MKMYFWNSVGSGQTRFFVICLRKNPEYNKVLILDPVTGQNIKR